MTEVEEAYKKILSYANRTGEVTSESLENTPVRARKALEYLLKGYNDPDFNFTVFENQENYNQIVLLKDI